MLDWVVETQGIAPTSLHSFDGDRTLLGGSTHGPHLITDPQVCFRTSGESTWISISMSDFDLYQSNTWMQGRCAATLLPGCLAVLPSMEIEALDVIIELQTDRQALSTTVGNSYMLKLAKLGISEVTSAAHPLFITTEASAADGTQSTCGNWP